MREFNSLAIADLFCADMHDVLFKQGTPTSKLQIYHVKYAW